MTARARAQTLVDKWEVLDELRALDHWSGRGMAADMIEVAASIRGVFALISVGDLLSAVKRYGPYNVARIARKTGVSPRARLGELSAVSRAALAKEVRGKAPPRLASQRQ